MPAEDAQPSDAKEEIEIRLDGVKVASVKDLPAELRADVEKRIAQARKSLAPKYAPGKLRMRINVKHKTSAAALKAAGKDLKAKAAPAVTVEEKEGSNWFLIGVLVVAALIGVSVFVPGLSDAVTGLVARFARSRPVPILAAPAAAPAAPAPSAAP